MVVIPAELVTYTSYKVISLSLLIWSVCMAPLNFSRFHLNTISCILI